MLVVELEEEHTEKVAPELDTLLSALKANRDEAKRLKEQEDALVRSIWLLCGNRKTRVIGDQRAIFITQHRTTLNEEGLRKALRAKVWGSICKRVVDTHKLEQAIASGAIDPVVVQTNTSVMEVKQIRFQKNAPSPVGEVDHE